MFARRALALVAAACAVVGVRSRRLSKVYGIFPGEDLLQDFWGPVRAAFEGSVAYEKVWAATSDAEVNASLASILAAHPAEDAVVVGPMRHGERHYADFLRRGGAAFFLAEGVDGAKYGLDANNSFQWVFNPDTRTAAEDVAAEICRKTGPGYHHRVLLLYGSPYADVRVDRQIEWLAEFCPKTTIEVARHVRGLFLEDLAEAEVFNALVADSSITTILACNDRMVKGALRAIDRAVSRAKAAEMIIAGFDWTENWMLKGRKIVASGDQFAGRRPPTGEPKRA